jgi:type I restriction enzyme M protein
MLNSETKRKIDSARNILVGNVTNPISQVDQITNALIYKFMDDMDQENVDVDLKAQFFIGDYAKYSWTKLLDKKLSGQERMNLYMQATESMSKNPHIPQLFRDIFKGAFLPYNDPRVLTLFLKEIAGFSYSHSEELGNAFEYLLSILGSQGDAGQFRTPRHIIDFIAEVVDPKKNETILDPACGTAGFLISAYKHILKAHDGLDNKTGKPTNKEKNLTPAEKTKLMNNIVGYDVSPDMVKLSLVNMYLHGFQNPKIHKYNTLTDEKRWDEQFDVIMANPPFMTPKGGVETHKRFSIQANRAEVLFVDYIMEHLSIKGRAGIIVPEGIIFKSDKAYKALRKKLVEDGLFAVVSLPTGVFQPYSGVKTSILLFDNQVAKKTDEILFVKVSNDGFDLGAQRRPRPDLPNDLFDKGGAIDVLKAQSIAIQTGNKNTLVDDKSSFAWTTTKKEIVDNDYSLVAVRYENFEHLNRDKGNWPMVKLSEVIKTIVSPLKIQKTEFQKKGQFPIIDQSQNEIAGLTDNEEALVEIKKPLVIFGDHTCVVKYIERSFAQGADGIKIIETDDQLLPKFLYFYLKNKPIKLDGYKRHFTKLKSTRIPLPPLEIQKEIVAQIEVKQNVINHAKEIIKNLERERRYFGQELRKLEGVEMVELGEVAEVVSGQSPESKYYNKNGNGLPFYQGKTEFTDRIIGEPRYWTTKTTKVAEKDDILMSVRAPVGPVNFTTQKICIGRGLAAIRVNKKINPIYLFVYLQSIQDEIKGNGGAVFDSINRSQIEKIKIPIPPSTDTQTSMDIQSEIVEEIEWEETIIESNKKLIELMVKKIAKVIEEI